MQFGKVFDSLLHPSPSSTSASSSSTQDALLSQLLDLEKKKFHLQKQKGQIDVDSLKERIQQLVGEVSQLDNLKEVHASPISPIGQAAITPMTTTQTPAFLHTVHSTKIDQTPLPSSSVLPKSNRPLIPHSAFKPTDIAALLAEKENDSFSDDDLEDEVSLNSFDRRKSTDSNRHSLSRNSDLSEVFNPRNVHHPLSNRINYNNIGRPPSVGAGNVGGSKFPTSTYTPPRLNPNIRTISTATENENDRGSFGSTGRPSSTTLPYHPPIDETITRIESIDYPFEIGTAGAIRASLTADDLEVDFLDLGTANAADQEQSLLTNQNLLEFCIIEADWQELLKNSVAFSSKEHISDPSQPHLLTQPKYLSNLVPPKLIWRFPPNVDEETNNTSTIQEQNFFFPSGVKVELVSKTVMEIKTRYYNFKRHIVPFSDRQGLPLYACCLTVNQSYEIPEVQKIHEDIPLYLYRIARAKTAAKILQKAFRQYQRNKRIKQWQSIDIADIKRLQQEKQFFTNIGASTNSETTATSSQHGRFSLTGNTPQSGNRIAGAGGFFSRLFRRGTNGESANGISDLSSHPHAPGESSFFNFARHDKSTHGKSDNSFLASPPARSNSELRISTAAPAPLTAHSRSRSLNFFGRGSTASRDDNKGSVTGKESEHRSHSKSIDSSPGDLLEISQQSSSSLQKVSSSVNIQGDAEGKDEAERSSETLVEILLQSIDAEEEERKQKQAEEEAAALEQFNYLSFLEDKVVIGQKAYCIISSSPEYTFIFKILDAIHEAETEFTKQNLTEAVSTTTGNSFTISEEEHAQLRGKFLIKIKIFIEKYLINKQFQLEDLSNHFIIPKDYFQFKMNYYPFFQSNDHHQRYNFYHKLMFPHRYIPTNNTTQQQLEDEINSSFFDSVVNSPRATNPNTPNQGRYRTRTFSLPGNRSSGRFFAVESTSNTNLEEQGKISPLGNMQVEDITEGEQKERTAPSSLIISEEAIGTSSAAIPSTETQTAETSKVEEISPTTLKRLSLRKVSNTRVASASVGDAAAPYAQTLRVRGYGKPVKIDFRYLLSTKEWSCAVLFTHLNSQVIFKIINLLLMEKSLIIYGKNPGIVSAITLGVVNLISPFLWEGIFIPLVPDVARELFGAPVPLIIGTISPPRMADVSAGTAILHLNDDAVQAKLLFTLSPIGSDRHTEESSSSGREYSPAKGVRIPSQSQKRKVAVSNPPSSSSSTATNTTTAAEILKDHHITVHVQEVDFLAWFTRLPEVSADLPVQEELTKRVTHLRKQICHYLLPHLHYVYDILLYDPKVIQDEIEQQQQQQQQHHHQTRRNHRPSSSRDPFFFKKTIEKSIQIKNTTDHLLLTHHLPLSILQQITTLLIRLKHYNYEFCGEILNNTHDWNRFLKKNPKTNLEEFYPNLFLEPLRNKLEFQESMVHTQMFISFLDRVRKESIMLNQIREFIGHWIYRQIIRKRRKSSSPSSSIATTAKKKIYA